MNVAAFLTKAAVTFPDRPALAVGATPVHDYRSFAERASALAYNLRHKLGLAPGDRVAITTVNQPEFMIAVFACWIAGLVAVPINAKLHRKEFAYILENSGTRAVFLSQTLEPTVGGLEREIDTLEQSISTGDKDFAHLLTGDALPVADADPNDPAWLFYTSGTTGRPKGATLTHRNIIACVMNHLSDVDPTSPDDAIIHSAPMSHASGITGISIVARAANQVIPESGGFDPPETFDLIRHYPGAVFFFAPTMIVRLSESAEALDPDTTNLKTVVYGGGPMYLADMLRALDLFGNKFVQIYGQGEAPMTITGIPKWMHADTGHPRYKERLASVGFARTDVEVKVFDAQDRALPAGEIGEIVLRGDVVMKGYWENPEATAKALAGGWLHTGDVGSFDEDGFLTLKDRSKDLIISGGTNIYPREIEEVLLTHEGVLETSIIGRPHPEWGEEVVAFVVRKPGADLDNAALDRLCLDNIARFKRPKDYRFVDALPKNNYGKVLKTELREWLAAESGATDEEEKADAV